MKSHYSFEIMELDDEMVAVPVGGETEHFHGVIKVNETAAAILQLLEEDTTEDEIVASLMKEYTGDKDEIAGYVHDFVSKMMSEGIVE